MEEKVQNIVNREVGWLMKEIPDGDGVIGVDSDIGVK